MENKIQKVSENEINDFISICERNSLPPEPGSRFVCMCKLDKEIQKCRGAYTETVRQDWLNILYTCLAAPDCYFSGQFQHNVSKKTQKRIEDFMYKRHSLICSLNQERTNERAMYTYIQCVRTYYDNAKRFSSPKENANPYAVDLRESIFRALQIRMADNPSLQKFEKAYQSKLRQIFEDDKRLLNAPVFFLFLPYYVFFELAKCEKLIPENTNAFSCIQLGGDKPRWSIRNAPFIRKEIDPDQITSLYQLVENALCQALQKQEYGSIGRDLWLTNYEIQNNSPNSSRYSDEWIQQTMVGDAIDFSAPFWQYDAWSAILCNAFSEQEIDQNELELDIHKLFSLEFRGSRQSTKGQSDILQKYKNYTVCLRKCQFDLSELLRALCRVYSLLCHGEGHEEIQRLCIGAQRLTGFLIACGKIRIENIDASPKYQQLLLVREGYPYGAFEQKDTASSNDIDRYLCCPSRILFSAVFARWNLTHLKRPKRYILSDGIPYSESLKKISDALYHALCSEKAVLRDILIWGGVKVVLDNDYICSLKEAIHIWSVWHPREAKVYSGLEQYLRSSPDLLDKIAEGPVELSSNAVELDLSDYEFDEQMTSKLLKLKKWIFYGLGLVNREFEEPEYLSDFRYVMLLYYAFRALRDRMCTQAYDICSKVLDTHSGPPLMFMSNGIDVMLETDKL